MKKILSFVLTVVMTVPLSLIPSTAVAAGNYAISINEPVSVSGQTVTLTGNASSSDYVGGKTQQHVAIWWTSASLSGDPAVDFVVPDSAFSGKSFNWNWSSNHTYSAGTYTITVKVCHQSCTGAEGSVDSVDTTVVVIPPANTAPSAQAKSIITNEDTATSSAVKATDSDVPAQTLTYSIVANPTHGSITGFSASTGAFTYTPSSNYVGSDSFTFKANDGTSDSSTATVSITVNPLNDAPVSIASTVSTDEDTAVTASLSASDIDGDTLSYSTTTNPTHGTLTLNSATGSYTYTPDLNYNGSDSFSFNVYDGTVNSNTSTVSITVNSVNDTPTISSVADKTVDELVLLNFTASASDVDSGDTIIYSLSGATSGMSIDANTGVFSWTPTEAQGAGDYTVTVVATDNHSASTNTVVNIHVNEVNVAPTTLGDSVSTHQNTAKLITLSGADTDLPANTLAFIVVTQPTHGTLGVVSGNQVTYTPDTDYMGADSFTFKVNDGTIDSNVSTISINVSDTAPTLGEILDKTIDEMVPFTFTVSGTDPDLGDTLTYSLTSLASGFSFDTNSGVFNWTPTESQGPGVYSFMASVSDGAQTDSQPFQITVSEVNIAPVSNDGSVSTAEDTSVSGTLTGSDADLPANTLTFATTTSPANGTITAFDASSGAFTYAPNANYNGSDSFKFVVNDETVNSAESTITITVTPVNDVPTITLKGGDPINLVTGDTFVDPSASSTDVEDGDLLVVITGTVDANTPGTYTLTYTATDTNSSSVSVTRQVIVTSRPVENTQSLCSDGQDNDNDELIDLADPDCAPFIPAPVDFCSNIEGVQTSVPSGKIQSGEDCVDAPAPVTPPSGGGGGANGPVNFGFVTGGSVLGASATKGEVLGESCGLYLNTHFRLGSSKNNASQVKKLQEFLNKSMGTTLPVTGFYGPMTYGVVKNFQTKYSDDVLKPWGLTSATGLVYLSTVTKINNLECPELMAELPTLVPWSQNPNAQ